MSGNFCGPLALSLIWWPHWVESRSKERSFMTWNGKIGLTRVRTASSFLRAFQPSVEEWVAQQWLVGERVCRAGASKKTT